MLSYFPATSTFEATNVFHRCSPRRTCAPNRRVNIACPIEGHVLDSGHLRYVLYYTFIRRVFGLSGHVRKQTFHQSSNQSQPALEWTRAWTSPLQWTSLSVGERRSCAFPAAHQLVASLVGRDYHNMISQTLHVCHVCLHWGGFGGQCRHIWHTWSVWV